MNSEQRHNLEMLAAALAGGWTPMAFDMGVYEDECGTTGCALGHAPHATGIQKDPDEEWEDYCERVLGLISFLKFDFCFSCGWVGRGNEPTAHEAADRIAWVLDGGDVQDARYIWKTYDPGERPWSGYFERSGRTPGGWHGLSQAALQEEEG